VSLLNSMMKRIISAVAKQFSSRNADGQKNNHAGDAFVGKQSVKQTRFAEE